MGRKPVLVIAGALVTGLALTGCQSGPDRQPLARNNSAAQNKPGTTTTTITQQGNGLNNPGQTNAGLTSPGLTNVGATNSTVQSTNPNFNSSSGALTNRQTGTPTVGQIPPAPQPVSPMMNSGSTTPGGPIPGGPIPGGPTPVGGSNPTGGPVINSSFSPPPAPKANLPQLDLQSPYSSSNLVIPSSGPGSVPQPPRPTGMSQQSTSYVDPGTTSTTVNRPPLVQGGTVALPPAPPPQVAPVNVRPLDAPAEIRVP